MTLFLSTKYNRVLAKEAHGCIGIKPSVYTIYCQNFFLDRGLTDRERKLLVVLLLYNNSLFISGLTIKVQLNHKPEDTM